MVLVKPSSTYQHQMLVGSDLLDSAAARREVEAWLAENDYRIPAHSRPLSVFEDGIFVREWVLAQRNTDQDAATPVTSWTRLFQRSSIVRDAANGSTIAFLPTAPAQPTAV